MMWVRSWPVLLSPGVTIIPSWANHSKLPAPALGVPQLNSASSVFVGEAVQGVERDLLSAVNQTLEVQSRDLTAFN